MKLNRIHKNHKGQLWCGIAALSAITGNPTQHSKDCIRLAIDEMERKGRRIKGVYIDEMLAALSYLCIDFKQIYNCKHRIFKSTSPYFKQSLARFLHGHKPKQGNLYLVIIPDHFLVTDGLYVVDSLCPEQISLYDYPEIESQVEYVYELTDSALENL